MNRDFKGYEYREILVKQSTQHIYEDSFGCFGWIEDGVEYAVGKVDSLIMKFKRDRKIVNKAELTRLQRQFEAYVNEIDKLEFSKTSKASVAAYSVGVIGAAFMTGAVFAFNVGNIILCTVLAVPAFIGWIVPYWLYKHLCNKRIAEVTPLIEQKYDELYEVCEKANALLYN